MVPPASPVSPPLVIVNSEAAKVIVEAGPVQTPAALSTQLANIAYPLGLTKTLRSKAPVYKLAAAKTIVY